MEAWYGAASGAGSQASGRRGPPRDCVVGRWAEPRRGSERRAEGLDDPGGGRAPRAPAGAAPLRRLQGHGPGGPHPRRRPAELHGPRGARRPPRPRRQGLLRPVRRPPRGPRCAVGDQYVPTPHGAQRARHRDAPPGVDRQEAVAGRALGSRHLRARHQRPARQRDRALPPGPGRRHARRPHQAAGMRLRRDLQVEQREVEGQGARGPEGRVGLRGAARLDRLRPGGLLRGPAAGGGAGPRGRGRGWKLVAKVKTIPRGPARPGPGERAVRSGRPERSGRAGRSA